MSFVGCSKGSFLVFGFFFSLLYYYYYYWVCGIFGAAAFFGVFVMVG